MITCRQLVEMLFDYLAGELSPEQRDGLEQHLQQCSPCGTFLQTYQLTIHVTRRLPPVALSPERAARFQALLEAHSRGPNLGQQGEALS
jgi:anti-sigma factor RsiW